MTAEEPPDQLTVSIRVGDPELADRVTALLTGLPGLRVAAEGEPCDLIVGESSALAGGDLTALTPRERDVLALLSEGLSNRAIGARLGIATDTAKFHVGRIIDKLDATGRTDAVAHAVRRGVIHL